VIISAILVALPAAGTTQVVLYDTSRFLLFRALDDSWFPITQAYAYLQDPGPDPVYDAIFFDGDVKFQYALTSLLPLELLQLFRDDSSLDEYGPLDAVSWIAVWATAVFVALIFLRSLENYAPEFLPAGTLERWLLGAIAAGMTLTFYPIAKAFSLGQIQAWINCLFAILVWLWVTKRETAAGVVGGLICAIKPQLGLLLVWALLRRRWGFAGLFAAVAGSLALITLVLYGLEDNLNYLDVLSYISRRGEAYYPNQSVNGLLNRLLDNGNNTDFQAGEFPPFNVVVYVGTIVTSIVIVGAALFWRADESGADSTVDLLIAGLSFTIASPVAWEHHYGILMPAFAVLLPAMLRWPVLGKWSLPILGLAYLLSANFYNLAQKFAGRPLLTPVQSYLFFGALIVLVLLYLVRHAVAASGPDAAQPQPVNSNAPEVPAGTSS
jgi:hypothetical protein